MINTIERNENKIKEIERLNNIINELEKYLDEALGQDMYRYDFYIILKKLKELKEGDK